MNLKDYLCILGKGVSSWDTAALGVEVFGRDLFVHP